MQQQTARLPAIFNNRQLIIVYTQVYRTLTLYIDIRQASKCFQWSK